MSEKMFLVPEGLTSVIISVETADGHFTHVQLTLLRDGLYVQPGRVFESFFAWEPELARFYALAHYPEVAELVQMVWKLDEVTAFIRQELTRSWWYVPAVQVGISEPDRADGDTEPMPVRIERAEGGRDGR